MTDKIQTIEVLSGKDIELIKSILVEGLSNLKITHVVMIVERRKDKNQ